MPLYKQIAELLRDGIRAGAYPPGVALPSERKLMAEFKVTRSTVRGALAQLRSEGLVTMEQGAGVFVRKPPPPRRIVGPQRFARRDRHEGKAAYLAEMEREGRKPEVEVLHVGRVRAPVEVAQRLGVPAGSPVLQRHRLYLADDVPVEVATSWLPYELVKGTQIVRKDTGPGGLYARLEEGGHTIASFVEEVTARMPTVEERALLQLHESVPVLRVVRSASGEDGRVLEICDTVMAADRYVLTYPYPAR